MSGIKVIAVLPNEEPQIREIGNDLESMQEFVQGHIECVFPEDGIILICHEEGRLRDLPDNRDVPPYGMIKGPFLLCGGPFDGEFGSMPGEDAQKWLDALKLSDGPRGPRF